MYNTYRLTEKINKKLQLHLFIKLPTEGTILQILKRSIKDHIYLKDKS